MPDPARQVRAVIVEDEPDLAHMLCTYLSQQGGVEVFHAADGETGWSLVVEHRPDVLVVDLMVPQLSGAELIGKVRADPALREMPILAMSASLGGAEQAQQMVQILDVQAAMPKPLVLKEFLKTVQRLGGAG